LEFYNILFRIDLTTPSNAHKEVRSAESENVLAPNAFMARD